MGIQRLKEIAQKYEFLEFTNQIDNLEKESTLKIGFVGKFSSGKSSLINNILGTTILPIGVMPTTKNITEILPKKNIEKNNYFLKDDEDNFSKISGSEFRDSAINTERCVLRVDVPESGLLKNGYEIIDTPGLNSSDTIDSDLTFGYLTQLDGMIFCHDINEGNMSDTISNFIKNPEIKYLIEKFIFVITKSDLKTNSDRELIRKKIIEELISLQSTHNFVLKDIENRVVLSNEEIITESSDFYNSFSNIILKNSFTMRKNRKIIKISELTKDLKKALVVYKDNCTLETGKIDEEKSNIENQINEVKADITSKKKDISKLEEILKPIVLSETTQSFIKNTTDGKFDSENMLKNLTTNLTESVKPYIQKYSDNLIIPPLFNKLSIIEDKLDNATKGKDLFVLVATAAITAGMASGTTAVANAGEAAAGGAVRQAAKKGATETAKKIIEKEIESIGLKILKNVSKVLKEINPLEHIGDFAIKSYTNTIKNDDLKIIANNITSNICLQIENDYTQKVIDPINKILNEKQMVLNSISKDKFIAESDFMQKRANIDDDICTL